MTLAGYHAPKTLITETCKCMEIFLRQCATANSSACMENSYCSCPGVCEGFKKSLGCPPQNQTKPGSRITQPNHPGEAPNQTTSPKHQEALMLEDRAGTKTRRAHISSDGAVQAVMDDTLQSKCIG